MHEDWSRSGELARWFVSLWLITVACACVTKEPEVVPAQQRPGRGQSDAGPDQGSGKATPEQDAQSLPVDAATADEDAGGEEDAGEETDDAGIEDAGELCADFQAILGEEVRELARCDADTDCQAVDNPLCGTVSDQYPGDCYLFARADATLDALNVALRSCAERDCGAACEPADCDCKPMPQAACVNGHCRTKVREEELAQCAPGDECIVVPYEHCCGATKRAIRADFRVLYEHEPEWQSFNDPPTCATIGLCADDSTVTEARCESGSCTLVFP